MATATRTKKPTKMIQTQLSVDYPPQGATVTSPEYVIRVSAPEHAGAVAISVDDGDWEPCRKAAGHWWFDWSGYEDGEHELIARVLTAEGREIASEPHEFFVSLDKRTG